MSRHRPFIAAAALVSTIVVVSIELFAFLWRRQAFEAMSWLAAIGIFIGGAIAHECLHAVTWKAAGRVPWRALTVKRSRRKLGVIADIDGSIEPRAYRIGLVSPAIVLGLLPIVAGLIGGHGLILLWGCVFLFESFSDVAILFGMPR